MQLRPLAEIEIARVTSRWQTADMKVLILSLLASTGVLFAGPLDAPQDRPHPVGFIELEWGTALKKAQTAFEGKPGVTLVARSNDNTLEFRGGKFLDAPVEAWTLIFAEDRLVEGRVHFKPTDPRRVYNELRSEISKKYRKGGRQETENSSHSATYWSFDSKEGAYGIACDINADGIRLIYKQSRSGPSAVKSSKKQL